MVLSHILGRVEYNGNESDLPVNLKCKIPFLTHKGVDYYEDYKENDNIKGKINCLEFHSLSRVIPIVRFPPVSVFIIWYQYSVSPYLQIGFTLQIWIPPFSCNILLATFSISSEHLGKQQLTRVYNSLFYGYTIHNKHIPPHTVLGTCISFSMFCDNKIRISVDLHMSFLFIWFF